MRHLIIGAGNMGRKHGGILQSLGDDVLYADDGWRWPSYHRYGRVDSVLVCTPPSTHEHEMADVWSHYPAMPIFCEKPFVTLPVWEIEKFIPFSINTFVACNWRWCKHIAKIRKIELSYPTATYNDLVHFVDAWKLVGYAISLGHNKYHLSTRKLSVTLRRDYVFKTSFDNEIVDHTNCDMFVLQMQHWRDVVCHRAKSFNPFASAAKRLKTFYAALNKARDL